MSPPVCNGARSRCSHGIGLGTLSVPPVNRGPISGEPEANISCQWGGMITLA